ncbi:MULTISPECIES: DUF5131 family protein [Flavobacteriaceae]|uniref:DUF5131 family protein n=1 Tax=Flavobacteriaceae TaxID=49546 RepID=UPI0014914549|nr:MULTISPECIES: DUF5131 family protein [Allomuricauda]MDC6364831.1 DUF5131 family protein [Muricauda sp. AC10]
MSSIEWTEKTWNPTTGCTKISKECDNCYAEVMTKRLKEMGQKKYQAGWDVMVEHEDTLKEPYSWKNGQVVFVNSMSDLFHKDVSLDFIKKVFKVMNDTPQHTYQVLTKRADILNKYSAELNWTDNIWMGVSVGSNASVRKIERLKQCDAKNKFLSVEPLIEELKDYSLRGIDWVIVGGESGGGARELKMEWVESVRQKCIEDGVPFFFKQWGMDRFNPNECDPTISKLHRYHSKGGSQLNGKTYWNNPAANFNSDDHKVILFGTEHEVMDEVYSNDNRQAATLKTIWELKSYLPFNEDSTYGLLKKDIQKNGVIDPVLYFKTENGDNIVVEGHTRLRAAKQTKKAIPSRQIKENFNNLDEIKLWMVKHQLQRRNLSNTEKVRLAYSSRATIEKLAKENLSKAGKGSEVEKQIDTNDEIAKIAGVGRATVGRYISVVNKGNEALIKKLHKGDITIGNAYHQVAETKRPASNKSIESKLEIVAFDNLDDAKESFSKNEVDYVVLSRDRGVEAILKKSKASKVGVVCNF